MTKLVLVSAAALIDRDGRVLMTTRPADRDYAGMWEFPGGKIEPGETPEAALVRELEEELGIMTHSSCLAPFSFGSAEHGPAHLLMPLFVCRKWDGMVQAREGQRTKWVRPTAMLDLPMPPIDRPLAAQLRDFLVGG